MGYRFLRKLQGIEEPEKEKSDGYFISKLIIIQSGTISPSLCLLVVIICAFWLRYKHHLCSICTINIELESEEL